MKKFTGFTLVELMVTIAVAAILLTVAIPSFVDTLRKNRLTSEATDILTALNVGRSEAIKLGANVTVCSSTDMASCSAANDWSTGWVVLQGGTLIRAWDGLSSSSSLTGNGSSVIFTSRGMATVPVGAPLPFQLNLTATGCGPDEQRNITVTQTGRTNTQTVDCP